MLQPWQPCCYLSRNLATFPATPLPSCHGIPFVILALLPYFSAPTICIVQHCLGTATGLQGEGIGFVPICYCVWCQPTVKMSYDLPMIYLWLLGSICAIAVAMLPLQHLFLPQHKLFCHVLHLLLNYRNPLVKAISVLSILVKFLSCHLI